MRINRQTCSRIVPRVLLRKQSVPSCRICRERIIFKIAATGEPQHRNERASLPSRRSVRPKLPTSRCRPTSRPHRSQGSPRAPLFLRQALCFRLPKKSASGTSRSTARPKGSRCSQVPGSKSLPQRGNGSRCGVRVTGKSATCAKNLSSRSPQKRKSLGAPGTPRLVRSACVKRLHTLSRKRAGKGQHTH